MERVAKICVEEGGVVNAIPAANHRVMHMTEQACGCIGETDTRTNILIVRLSTGGTGTVRNSPKCSSGSRIGQVRVEDGLNAIRFMTRSIHVVPKAQVESQVLAELEIVLDKPNVIVLDP